MSKIIRPEGDELIKYLNEGYAICNNCGAIMELRPGSSRGSDLFICPACGWEVETMDYEYDDDTELEWAPNMVAMFKDEIPPEGCIACGGPYPHCRTSCKMFDD